MSLLALKYEDAVSSTPPRIQGSDISSIHSHELEKRKSFKQPPIHLRQEDAPEVLPPTDSLVALPYERTVTRARPSTKRTTVVVDTGPRRLKSRRHTTVVRYQDIRPSTPPVIGTEPATAGFRNFSRPSYIRSSVADSSYIGSSRRWSTSSSCYDDDDIIDDYSHHAETTPSEDSRASFVSSAKTGTSTPPTSAGSSFTFNADFFPLPADEPALPLKRYAYSA